MATSFTLAFVYFFIWFANFCLVLVGWSDDEKIELLINFSLQNTFMFGVKLCDYHNRMKTAASWLSAIINFDASFFVPDAIGTKNWRQNVASNL